MAITDPRKKVNKIRTQIVKIASKGKDHTLEYHKLIDEIVSKGDYAYLEMCLSDFYNIDTSKYKTIYEIKTKTWKNILFETDATVITGLKRLYKANSIYQQGQEIRSDKKDYTIVTMTDAPFKEEVVTISDVWNNKVTRSVYSQVATASQILITKADVTNQDGLTYSNTVSVMPIDEYIYQIEVSKVIWATYSVTGTQSQYIITSPYELKRLAIVRANGTQSHITPDVFYRTNIPMNGGGDYLITVSRRNTTGWLSPELTYEKYSYKVYVRKDDLLGTIKEIDYYDPGSNYLHLNQRFAQLTGVKKTFLEVLKNGNTGPITIVYDNPGKSEDGNLLDRYKIAIQYLNS